MNSLLGDVPLGLGMALAQNIEAMNSFAAMTDEQKMTVIDRAHGIQSKQEMRAYVDSLRSGEVY